VNTRALLTVLVLSSGAAWAKPPEDARIWTVTLRSADADLWCEATALGSEQLRQFYTVSFRLTDAGVDLVLSYDGALDDADEVTISLDSRQAGSAAVAVRGSMDRDYLGRTRHQATVIAPISATMFTTTLAPALPRSRTLTLQLGERRFDMALYGFDDALKGLARCAEAMRRTRSRWRAPPRS
jgi:hypothetical protein